MIGLRPKRALCNTDLWSQEGCGRLDLPSIEGAHVLQSSIQSKSGGSLARLSRPKYQLAGTSHSVLKDSRERCIACFNPQSSRHRSGDTLWTRKGPSVCYRLAQDSRRGNNKLLNSEHILSGHTLVGLQHCAARCRSAKTDLGHRVAPLCSTARTPARSLKKLSPRSRSPLSGERIRSLLARYLPPRFATCIGWRCRDFEIFGLRQSSASCVVPLQPTR